MKKSLIAVFAMAACGFAANPYTGLMKNLNIATFGVAKDISYIVDFAKGFRTSMEKHVSKKYPETTFKNSYSNGKISDVKVSNFQERIQKDYNIVLLAGHGLTTNHRYPDGSVVQTHNVAVMYDGNLPVENMSLSETTYFSICRSGTWGSGEWNFWSDTRKKTAARSIRR